MNRSFMIKTGECKYIGVFRSFMLTGFLAYRANCSCIYATYCETQVFHYCSW